MGYRAEIGDYVVNRLSRAPGAFQIPSKDLVVFVVRDFFTAEECEGLIKLIDTDRIPSQLLAPTPDPNFRTSESCNLQPFHPHVRKIEEKITRLMGIQPEHGEAIQGQRYAVGQQFKPHHDFFHEDQPYWPDQERTGGQRTWTCMAFLNQPEKGGATNFPDAGVKIAPRAGNLLAWNNLDLLGNPNPFSLHQGMPVEEGTKYVITKWYRERPWAISTAPTY